MDILIESTKDIERSAQVFASHMQGHSIFAFYGVIGAGKTTFITALCKVLGVTEAVTSPSFAIVNEYHSAKLNQSIYHFDFYRIKRIEEVYDLGYEEYFFSNGICFIEWPELIEELLPIGTVKVTLNVLADGSRQITANF